MIYDIHWLLMLFLVLVSVQVTLWPSFLVYDIIKGNKFRPVYRFFFPFIALLELFS